MTFRIKVNHNFARGAAEVATYPTRLNGAMRRGTERATEAVRDSVVAVVTARTGMDDAMARNITDSKVLPGSGSISRGQVTFKNPPARFYPKTRKALSFVIDGKRITVKSVRGSRPYKLIGRGASAAERAVEEGYEQEVRKVL